MDFVPSAACVVDCYHRLVLKVRYLGERSRTLACVQHSSSFWRYERAPRRVMVELREQPNWSSAVTAVQEEAFAGIRTKMIRKMICVVNRQVGGLMGTDQRCSFSLQRLIKVDI